MGSPSMRIVPASGSTKPAIARSSVVFPLPLGPSSAKSSPLLDAQVDIVERQRLAEAPGHSLDLDDAHRGESPHRRTVITGPRRPRGSPPKR